MELVLGSISKGICQFRNFASLHLLTAARLWQIGLSAAPGRSQKASKAPPPAAKGGDPRPPSAGSSHFGSRGGRLPPPTAGGRRRVVPRPQRRGRAAAAAAAAAAPRGGQCRAGIHHFTAPIPHSQIFAPIPQSPLPPVLIRWGRWIMNVPWVWQPSSRPRFSAAAARRRPEVASVGRRSTVSQPPPPFPHFPIPPSPFPRSPLPPSSPLQPCSIGKGGGGGGGLEGGGGGG